MVRRVTPSDDVAETEAVIAEGVAELAGRYDVVAVGIGAAGWIADDRATVLFSPHLAWRNEPLRDALKGRIGLPVTVENDANAAAWAEYRLLELVDGDPAVLTGTDVTLAAREGDPAAVEIFTAMGRWLGRGIADLAAIIDPSVFVIGGGVSEAGNLLLTPAPPPGLGPGGAPSRSPVVVGGQARRPGTPGSAGQQALLEGVPRGAVDV